MIVFFPLISAALYGLGFALIDRATQTINVATYIFISGLVGILTALFLLFFRHEAVSFSFLTAKWQTVLIIAGAALAPGLGWILTIYAVKNISPAFVAFSEISYPLFTLLFLFLIFGVRQFSFHVVCGGGLVMLGSFIMIYGQMKTKAG